MAAPRSGALVLPQCTRLRVWAYRLKTYICIESSKQGIAWIGGSTSDGKYTIADGSTSIPLHLGGCGSVFVVFRGYATQNSWVAPAMIKKPLDTIHGPWKITFPPKWGAPVSITLNKLASWSDNSNFGVKYFPGTGTYTKAVQAPALWFQHRAHLWINLGKVKNLAEVTLNGKLFGVVWHTPYKVDVTSALQPGSNTITMKATNAWVNRLVGDS